MRKGASVPSSAVVSSLGVIFTLTEDSTGEIRPYAASERQVLVIISSEREKPRRRGSAMNIRWHGQSAYTLTGAEHTVALDPFGDLGALLGGRRRFDYPPV